MSIQNQLCTLKQRDRFPAGFAGKDMFQTKIPHFYKSVVFLFETYLSRRSQRESDRVVSVYITDFVLTFKTIYDQRN